MARTARLKIEGGAAWYHLYCRVAGSRGEYPLDNSLCRRRFVEMLRQLCSVYCCSVAGFVIMGNHYHFVVWFEAPREMSRKELYSRAIRLYPGQEEMLDGWLSFQWDRFAERVFDVSELMRSLNAAYARWYNRTFDRQGSFWGGRFKSTLLENERAVLDCLLYIELNPVRAGIVNRPEDYDGSSLYLREIKQDKWLVPLTLLTGKKGRKAVLLDYKARLYFRGSVPTKEGQARISDKVLRDEAARGFESGGAYCKRLRYFVDGLAIGGEDFVSDMLLLLKERGWYLRRKNPTCLEEGCQASLREQRSHALTV